MRLATWTFEPIPSAHEPAIRAVLKGDGINLGICIYLCGVVISRDKATAQMAEIENDAKLLGYEVEAYDLP